MYHAMMREIHEQPAAIEETLEAEGAHLREFADEAVLARISEQSFVEGGTSNVFTFDKDVPREV